MPLINCFPVAWGGGTDVTLKCVSGDVATGSLRPRNVLRVTGLGVTPVGVAVVLKSGRNSLNTEIAAVFPPFAKLYVGSKLYSVSSYDFFDGGFSITSPQNWGWDNAIHTYYAYHLE